MTSTFQWRVFAVLILALLLDLPIPPSADAATYNILDFGAPLNPTLALQKAVNTAAPGDTIYIPDGTYLITKTIGLKSNLTLAGQSQHGAILQFVGQGTIIDLSGLTGVQVTKLTLDANTNLQAATGIYATQGSRLNLNHLTIKNFLSRTLGPLAIHFNGPVVNCVVADNQLINLGTNSPWGGGIRCSWGACSNRILRNVISQTGRGGIFANNGSTDLFIQSNTVTGSGLASTALGIELWGGCGRSIVEDNVIDHWLSVDSSSYSSIRRNIVRDLSENVLAWAGLELVAATNVIFTDNIVDHGQFIGVSISNDPAKNNIFFGYNTIEYMAQWGAQLQGDAHGARFLYFYKNRFIHTVKNHPSAPYPADSGNGFRFNQSAWSVVFDSNMISQNQGLGLEFSGGLDQISVANNDLTGNSVAAVNHFPDAAVDLLWTNNSVGRTDTPGVPSGVPVSRGFAGATPAAVFTCPTQVLVGQPVTFTNASVTFDGHLAQLLWDFGDGLPSAIPNPVYTYAHPGIYRVSLVIWDYAGRGAHSEKLIQVTAPDPGIAQTDT